MIVVNLFSIKQSRYLSTAVIYQLSLFMRVVVKITREFEPPKPSHQSRTLYCDILAHPIWQHPCCHFTIEII